MHYFPNTFPKLHIFFLQILKNRVRFCNTLGSAMMKLKRVGRVRIDGSTVISVDLQQEIIHPSNTHSVYINIAKSRTGAANCGWTAVFVPSLLVFSL